jgi:hypothetical protein
MAARQHQRARRGRDGAVADRPARSGGGGGPQPGRRQAACRIMANGAPQAVWSRRMQCGMGRRDPGMEQGAQQGAVGCLNELGGGSCLVKHAWAGTD